MGNCTTDQKKFQTRKSYKFNKQIPTAKRFYQQQSELQITLSTWLDGVLPDIRDQGRVKQRHFKINTNSLLTYQSQKSDQYVCKQDNPDFNKINFQQEQKNKGKLTVAIRKKQKGYQISFHQQQHTYELVTGMRQIIQGDRILIGGTQFKFVKFIKDRSLIKKKINMLTRTQIQAINQQQNLITSMAFIQSFKMLSSDNIQKRTCRICTGQQLTSENPLISPCDCTGSIQYYHLNCWSQWACKSQKITQDLYVGHVIRQSCQICKKSLVQNQNYRSNMAAILSSAHKIPSPFIVLQGMHSLHNFPYYRNLKLNYIIYSFANKKQFTIGRSSSIQAKTLLDNSISALNTMIQLKDGDIYLSDLKSKHGTYIRVTEPVLIDSDHPRYFLFKNSLIQFKIQ